MDEETRINPQHSNTRQVLRTVGPLLAGTGALLIVVGVGSFFASFGSFEPPRYFWCCFVGMPLLAIGLAVTKMGFLGSFVRYHSGEVAPVQKDTFNYLAKGTQDGVKTLAAAVGEGLAAGRAARTGVHCRRCNRGIDADARFCKNCGVSLAE
jgi:hypothetical protein